MPVYKRTITPDASGDGTATIDVTSGYFRAVHITYTGSFAVGTDVVITEVSPFPRTIYTKANNNTSFSEPEEDRLTLTDENGNAVTGYDKAYLEGAELLITVDEAGASPGTVEVTILVEPFV